MSSSTFNSFPCIRKSFANRTYSKIERVMFCNTALINHLLAMFSYIHSFYGYLMKGSGAGLVQQSHEDISDPNSFSLSASSSSELVTFILKVFLESQYGHQSSSYQIQVTGRKKKQEKAKDPYNLFWKSHTTISAYISHCNLTFNLISSHLISHDHHGLRNIIF